MKKPKPRKARSIETLTALFACKGGPMRDKRLRRPKDARNSWRTEQQDS